jgi:beta-phosphoglucomutase-like phosphatase (HAD superfamily)
MTTKAILFGSIGTLVETSELQRRAFNQAFSEAGLDWNWSEEDYQRLLTKSGGRKRVQDFASQQDVTVDAQQLHLRKTEIFDTLMAKEKLMLRPGVASVISYAMDNDLLLAFVTSTSEANVAAVFCALGDQVKTSDFNFIGNDLMVSDPKPNPAIYQKAMSVLNLNARNCIAIEDTVSSMSAALAAGIRCIGFPGAFSATSDFSGAMLVTDHLSPDQV